MGACTGLGHLDEVLEIRNSNGAMDLPLENLTQNIIVLVVIVLVVLH